MKNVALLDTYLRKRAKDNLRKGPPLQRDVITHDPSGRVDRRFTEVQTQAQPVQQSRTVSPENKGKLKNPQRRMSGEQEMGIV
jgi:hypothetical protein